MSSATHASVLASFPLADGRSLYRLGFYALLLAGVGCREADAPTAPGADPRAPTALAANTPRLRFLQVSTGTQHSCGVTTDNLAYCWGGNSGGELGDGTTTGRRAPRLVAGGLRFRHVSAGYRYTCGLTTDDLAYCWGDGGWGTLGNGSSMTRRTPVAVAGGRRYRQLKSGFHHVCAVTRSDAVFCWGDNALGELGIGFASSTEVPVQAKTGTLDFRSVFAGGLHTCGLTLEGKAYCWGSNDQGQIGNGTHTRALEITAVSGGLTFAQLSVGTVHTCGVTTDRVAYCWGFNFSGQLGDGTQTERLVPVPVTGGLRFRGVSASDTHTCGITTGSQAYCWGTNTWGQLGDGLNHETRTSPVAVAGGLLFTALGGGVISSHTCGVTTSDRAYCWGYNIVGQLGHGTDKRRLTPVPVDPPQ